MTFSPGSQAVGSAAMRGHNEGTVYRERSTGRWVASVSTPQGRRKAYVPKHEAPTVAEGRARARQLLVELQGNKDAGIVAPPRLSLSAYLHDWIGRRTDAPHAARRRGRVRPATLRHLEMIVRVHIDPALGGVPLSRLTRPMVAGWVEGMAGSPRSIGHRYAVLRNALNAAVDRGIIARNVALGVVLPEIPKVAQPTLSEAQATRLLAETEGSRWHALWAVALGTGLRISEILGLTWDDWQGERLTVDAQLARRDGIWVRVNTKAARSREALILPSRVVAALEAHRLLMARERTPDWTHYGMIFVNERGVPFYEYRVLRELYATLERLGLPRVTIHALRHTSASFLSAGGVPEDVRMARLGHSTTDMARHYAKVGDEPDRRAAEVLNRALGG